VQSRDESTRNQTRDPFSSLLLFDPGDTLPNGIAPLAGFSPARERHSESRVAPAHRWGSRIDLVTGHCFERIVSKSL
jgi:hypothetical protein